MSYLVIAGIVVLVALRLITARPPKSPTQESQQSPSADGWRSQVASTEEDTLRIIHQEDARKLH